jgi:hypothetical protein
MKRLAFVLMIFLGGFVFAQSCPSKTTAENDAITFVGKITFLGNDNKVFIWFEYGEKMDNLLKTKEEMKKETGLFCLKVENLKPCAKYFYRAGIRNQEGTNYGEIKSIETKCNFNNGFRSVNAILPTEVFLKKCSSEKISFYVVNNTNVRRKVNIVPEGEINSWFKPTSLNFILPSKAKRKINWKINVPCDIVKDSYQVSLRIKNGDNIFTYPVEVKLKSESKLKLNTK